MIKVLFLIHDLGQGGAEKVLVNLVNNMDRSKFDIHVTALFGGGVNEQFLAEDIKYRTVWKKDFRGNSKVMKLLSPEQLHRICVKEHYDIEVSYLEGPSARVVSGCADKETKLYCWIHQNHFSMKHIAGSFRNDKEALKCYTKFDQIICVSQYMKDNFCSWIPVTDKCRVLYNTVESDQIREKSIEPAPAILSDGKVNLIAVGSLKPVKGFDRLLRITDRLKKERNDFRIYFLGQGPMKQQMIDYVCEHNLDETVVFLGYQTNPYKYVAKSDLFVCSSYSEGFSTAVTEALIVGTPVCTVEVSGMKEMLGESNEYGIVTENDEEKLFQAIKDLLDNPELIHGYKEKSKLRGKIFEKEKTVAAVEEFFQIGMN